MYKIIFDIKLCIFKIKLLITNGKTHNLETISESLPVYLIIRSKTERKFKPYHPSSSEKIPYPRRVIIHSKKVFSQVQQHPKDTLCIISSFCFNAKHNSFSD